MHKVRRHLFARGSSTRSGHTPRLNAVSCSISFPNYRVFEAFRYRLGTGIWWCVLSLDPSILWTHACLFCRGNAAASGILTDANMAVGSQLCLERLFAESAPRKPNPSISRTMAGTPDNCPTDPQAEVMVFESIGHQFIQRIYFLERHHLVWWQREGSNHLRSHQALVRPAYFKRRVDQAYWS